ncbi:DUF257 family protein [Pyrococcus horikoshii]|nr:DUF257 family protein [Pyrococcus horikoshii]HII60907.1 DUF257 family protein [Pyrococcus horikoshii]
MSEVSIFDIWKGTKFGESVLMEFDSLSFSPLGVYSLAYWARMKGFKVSVVDVLDTLKIYLSYAKMIGLGTSIANDIEVIKLGGRIDSGNVSTRIPITEEKVMEKELMKLYPHEDNEKTIVIVLGIEKFLALWCKLLPDILSFLNFMLSFVGEEWMKSFYFINVDLMKDFSFPALSMLEELSTTVVEISKRGPVLHYIVRKALNPEIDSLEGEIHIKELISEIENPIES